MCNPRDYFSQAEHVAMVRNSVNECLWGEKRAVIEGAVYQPLWWWHREIRVFREPGIEDTTVKLVCEEIDALSRKLDIGRFIFQTYYHHDSAMTQIRSSLSGGELDAEKLFRIAVSEYRRNCSVDGRRHGDIYVTRRPFINDHRSWGKSSFAHGILILSLHGNRQLEHGFLRWLVSHKATHLFGMSCHCNDIQSIEGYSYDRFCNMHYEISSSELCQKCKNFVRMWWVFLSDIQKRAAAF